MLNNITKIVMGCATSHSYGCPVLVLPVFYVCVMIGEHCTCGGDSTNSCTTHVDEMSLAQAQPVQPSPARWERLR